MYYLYVYFFRSFQTHHFEDPKPALPGRLDVRLSDKLQRELLHDGTPLHNVSLISGRRSLIGVFL